MLLKLPTRLLLAALLLLAILALTACAKDIPVYTPPSERPVAAAEQPWVQEISWPWPTTTSKTRIPTRHF